jgi:SPP1 gp7 family putative phage head morphogenesis protein
MGKSLAQLMRDFRTGADIDEVPSNRLVEPYRQSAWVHAAINHIAGEIAGRPLKFYDGKNAYDEARFAAWWAAPALGPKLAIGTQPRLAIDDVKRDLVAWAKLEGEFFLCLDDSWILPTASRMATALPPFLIAPPRRMRLIVRAGELEAYEYSDAGGHRIIFLPEQVIHWKAFNPYDDWRGVGAMQAAKIAAEGAFLTAVYLRDLMINNGEQGYIVVGKSGAATPDQREQIIADLREKRAAMRRGIAKDLFLTGDISVEKPVEASSSRSDPTYSRAISHQEVFVAFGIPPSMSEVKASFSMGKDSDYYQLIIRTCVPLGTQIAGALANVASRMIGRALTGELEWDDHPIMIDVRNSRLDIAMKLWASGQPMSFINEYLDLGMKPYPGWNVGYLPFSVAPVGADGTAPPPPDNSPDFAEPPAKEITDPAIHTLQLALLARQRLSNQAAVAARGCPCCTPVFDAALIDKTRDPKELARWRQYMQQRAEQIAAFKSRFNRWLMLVRRQVLSNIATEKSGLPGRIIRAAAADFLFNLDNSRKEFLTSMGRQHTLALNAAGQELMKELGKDDPFQFAPAKVIAFLRGRETKLANLPQEVSDQIRQTLEDGLQAGDTMDQLADRVRAECNDISSQRATTIAQTETSAAYGAGRQEAMQEAGITLKQWLTSGNANVRPAHQAANGQIVPVDEPFIVDGEELMNPGDSSGSPGNVINCHCVAIPIAADNPAADSTAP